jgi:penicillin-binding protein 1A
MSQITKITRISLWLLLTGSSALAVVLSAAYLYLSPLLPPVEVLKDVQLQSPSRIYSADNQLIGEFGEKRRSPITFDETPPAFVHAILSAEDDRFFSHHGVDIIGLLRAVSQLVLTGEKQSGGSTITMQVARNYFLSFERTFSRKFNEILLALQIERELPKEEILELYLNKIFLGNRAYGVEAAAQVYYGQPIGQLTLAQLAMIAGLPKAPSTFNPIVNPSRALVRRNWILGRMHELGYIDQIQLREAVASPITASYHGAKLKVNAPYVAEMARKVLYDQYGKKA